MGRQQLALAYEAEGTCDLVQLRCSIGLSDATDRHPAGRHSYKDYLIWLATDESAQKELYFEKLTRGWAIGSKEFKQALLEEIPEHKIIGVEDAGEGRELLWEEKLGELKAKFSEK